MQFTQFASRTLSLTIIFKLVDDARGFPRKEMYGVLISQPVGSFHGVVHVIDPVVLLLVVDNGIYTALRGHGVRPSREELRYHRYAVTFAAEAKRCSQTRTTRSNYHHVVAVIYQRIILQIDGQFLCHSQGLLAKRESRLNWLIIIYIKTLSLLFIIIVVV